MPPPYGGVPKVSLLYARAWREMGHQVAVTFVYRPEHADDHGAEAEYFFEYGSKPNKFKKALFLLKYFLKNPPLYLYLLRSYYALYPHLTTETVLYAAYGVQMDGVLEAFKPEVIMSQGVLIKTFMVSKLAQRRGIPITYVTYVEIFDQNMGVNKHLSDAQQVKYWTSFLEMADFVITISRSPKGVLRYLPKERIKVFYDTCDFSAYQQPIHESKQELRAELGLPAEMFLCGMVGAFHYRKGHHHLIQALGLLKKQGYTIGAAICGGTRNFEEDVAKWRSLAKEQGVAEQVFFFANFGEAQLRRLHKSIDLYCNLSHSTRSCGLDLALLEAMASGLPVVVYDNAELSDAVPEEKNGYLIKTGDIEAVAGAILKMYQKTPEELAHMGAISKALTAKTDIHETAKIHIDWFNELLRATARKMNV